MRAAVVVAMGASSLATPRGRAARIEEKYFEASRAVEGALIAAGALKTDGSGDGDATTALGKLLEAEFLAAFAMSSYWQRRAEGMERALRKALAADAFSDADRASAVACLHGHGSPGVDLKPLMPAERRLIENYRRTSDDDRALLRLLLERLGTTEPS